MQHNNQHSMECRLLKMVLTCSILVMSAFLNGSIMAYQNQTELAVTTFYSVVASYIVLVCQWKENKLHSMEIHPKGPP